MDNGKTEEPSADALVTKALGIIERNLEISENLRIRSTGSDGEMMDAYRLLTQASDLEPNNLQLRYASICALRLAAQFASALTEMEALVKDHPDFTLGKITLAGWKEDAQGIAPAMFRYPECTPTMPTMPPFYARFVKTAVLLPAREGIHPRAVFFLKDNEAYWTKEMMKDARVEIAVVHESNNAQLAAIYARFLVPGKRPDLHEDLHVLSLPKSDTSIAAIAYLCLQGFVDVVVMDNQREIIFNQRVALADGTKATLKRVREVLLATEGRALSNQEVLRICTEFQNAYTIDEIERRFFPPR